jgi:hypothetical protein
MEVHIERNLPRDRFDVFIFQRVAKGRYLYTLTHEGWTGEVIYEGGALRPSMSLDEEMLEGLVRAAEGHVHAQEATVRHLDDVIAVRDRLFTLVEVTLK